LIKKKFKVLSIDHIAIASKDFSGLEHLFSEVLGLTSTKKERVKTELVDVLKLYSEDKKTAIELLEPIENNTTVSKFLNSKIQGIHHLALTVDNILNAISYLKYHKIFFVYEKPQIGSDNKLINFIHPKFSPGILIELCQDK